MSSRRVTLVLLLVALVSYVPDGSVRAADREDDRQPTAAREADAEAIELPANLRVPGSLRPILERMLQRSPTFRQQIERLARKPAVRVNVMYGGLRGHRRFYALSTVRKHQYGAMRVETVLYVPIDVVEIMAHELEHVCEQIEGVDLPALADARRGGVVNLSGHYETLRAIRAGQRVTREYAGDGEEPRVSRAY